MKFHMQLLQVKASQVRSSTFFRCFHSHSTGLRSGAYGGSAPAGFSCRLGPPGMP